MFQKKINTLSIIIKVIYFYIFTVFIFTKRQEINSNNNQYNMIMN